LTAQDGRRLHAPQHTEMISEISGTHFALTEWSGEIQLNQDGG
jgi:hypothetical protein